MPKLPVEIGDIRIRYLKKSDFDSYVNLEKNEKAKRFAGGANLKSKDQLLINIRSYQPTTDLMAIAECDSDIYIGRCGFLDGQNNEAELHIVIDPKRQRSGIATKIVPVLVEFALEKHKIPVSVVDPKNEGSIALMKRLGWQRTGIKCSENYENGFYVYQPDGI